MTRGWPADTHYGDLTGSKQGTMVTYLADAAAHGARILTTTRAERIVPGTPAQVEATYTHPETGRAVRLTVRAKHVVLACGALETPALLLRSGLGGRAVGTGLHIHPATMVFGEYPGQLDGWWGPPQSAYVDEFREADGHGWLIENSHFYPGGYAALLPWESGREHKEIMSRLRHTALFLGIVRDRGSGRVTLGADGQAEHHYPMDDPGDRAQFAAALAAVIRLHEAAGATRIRLPLRGVPAWSRGEDLGEMDRCRAAAAGRRWRPDPLVRASDGHRADGAGSRDLGRAADRRAARQGRDLDRGHQRLPDGIRRQPDVHNDGACPPHSRARTRQAAGRLRHQLPRRLPRRLSWSDVTRRAPRPTAS